MIGSFERGKLLRKYISFMIKRISNESIICLFLIVKFFSIFNIIFVETLNPFQVKINEPAKRGLDENTLFMYIIQN